MILICDAQRAQKHEHGVEDNGGLDLAWTPAAAIRTKGACRRHTALAAPLPARHRNPYNTEPDPVLQHACHRHLCHVDDVHLAGTLMRGHTPISDSA